MIASSLVQRADAFADEAITWFAGHQPFVERLTHARRVQARLMAMGVTDEVVLAAARLYPIFPIGSVNVPLLTATMWIADEVAESVAASVACLAEEVAAQIGHPYGQWRERPSPAALVVLRADRECRGEATP